LARLRSQPPIATGQSPYTVAKTEGRARLLRYAPEIARQQTPILLVPSLIGRCYLLDLLPGRSLVEFLVQSGFEVYLVDWGTPGPDDRATTFHAHIDTLLRRFVREALRRSGVASLSLAGYSLGGVMAVSYAARWPEEVANLVLLSTPIDFQQQGLFSLWAREESLPVDLLIDTYGEMPAWMLRSSFLWLKPTLALRDLFSLWESLDDPSPREDLLALHQWLEDGVSIPGETYREMIKRLYRENGLVTGRFQVGGRAVSLSSIVCPLLNVTAREDHICPPPASLALMIRHQSRDAQALSIAGAHTAAALSASAELWPQLSAWLAARDRRMLP
jgi:polyhydroxyalkanoate synthase